MQLSPLYQLLIFIEDRKEASLDDLKFLSPAVLRGILGKMEAMKLVEKSNSVIKISKEGQNLLNNTLDYLHEKTIHWDGKWRFVSFSIPEPKRSLRDKLRRFLEEKGAKMVFNGLWISPLDISSGLTIFSKKSGIFKKILIIESNEISTGITKEELQTLWNFDSSKQDIYQFINKAEIFLKQRIRDSFEVKKIIFEYALILKSQPKLPIELFPSDWPQFRAGISYRKVKRLLTQKV
ncbi:MAG: hypothetical protein ABH810_03955 [bacterium]